MSIQKKASRQQASRHQGEERRVWRPSKQELLAAVGKTVPDVIAPGLPVVFVGINPGLWSGAVGRHFARPGNRFWPALHAGGFTDRVLSPFEEEELLRFGVGITNLVDRATVAADELSAEELREGGVRLEARMRKFRPRRVAFLGMGAYRTAFGIRRAEIGEQPLRVGGRRVWVLPNPSGLNAHFKPADFGRLFGELREAVGLPDARLTLRRGTLRR
jgi:double-stranded uracil-DNA glycosylase